MRVFFSRHDVARARKQVLVGLFAPLDTVILAVEPGVILEMMHQVTSSERCHQSCAGLALFGLLLTAKMTFWRSLASTKR